MNMAAKPCIICGESFPAKNPRRLLCGSIQCQRKRNAEHQRRYYGYETGRIHCRICGKPFEAERNRKVCSDACRQQSRRDAAKRVRENEKRMWSTFT